MLSRLLMTVLIALLALPAATMPAMSAPAVATAAVAAMPGCHEAQPTDRQQDQQQAPFQHQCIGCVAVWQALPCPAEPEALLGVIPEPLPVRSLAQARAGPEVPPPRA